LTAELRWILLGLSVPLLAFVWWWTARRASQTPGNAELRESAPPRLDQRRDESVSDSAKPAPVARDWGVPPFEPLNIRTAEFDHVPGLDRPMMVHADPAPHAPIEAMAAEPAAASAEQMTADVPVESAPEPAENSDRFTAPESPAPNVAELQKIVTVRVCTMGEGRWSGTQLMAALELHGLAFGRYQVFHRKHIDGRSLFCVASLIEPGTFDLVGIAEQEFRGVTMFAVMPGPITPLETLDELLRTARGLAEELSGMIQDGKGMPLSPQRAAALREDVARFQGSLARHTGVRGSL
jgi:cell division protein ZipA